jgi:branched-chain amino acid transport system substrate-binding protein
MAAEEINARGGILGRQIELHFENSESKSDEVVTQAAQRLVDRSEVRAIFAGYNPETEAVLLNVAADSGIIAMHGNTVVLHDETVKGDPERYWGGFQIDPPEIFYGTAFLNFVKNLSDTGQLTLANIKVAIIIGPGAYSGNIANAMKDGAASVGLEVSLFEPVNVPISEWGPTLAKLRADPPAVIAVTHFYPQDQAQFMLQFATDPTPSLIYMRYCASLTAGDRQRFLGPPYRKIRCNILPKQWRSNHYALHSYAVAASIAGGTGAPFNDAQNRKVAAALMGNIYRGVMGASRFVPETNSASFSL